MESEIRIDRDQVKALLDSRGWSRARLLEQLGARAGELEQAEARGTASASLACALASLLEVSPALLDGQSGQAKARRSQTASWITVGVAFVFLLSLMAGYQLGADLAKRHSYEDCVAAGGPDCVRR